MALALNIIALVLVVAISWLGMVWLGGRIHARRKERDLDEPRAEWMPEPDSPCDVCKGVGAVHKRGSIRPCPMCEGTGIRTTAI